MKHFKFIYTLILAALFVSCSKNEDPIPDDENNGEQNQSLSLNFMESRTYYEQLLDRKANNQNTPFSVLSAKMEGDEMVLGVNIPKGSVNPKFEVVHADAMIFIYPPQYAGLLNLKVDGTNGSGTESKTVRINLKTALGANFFTSGATFTLENASLKQQIEYRNGVLSIVN